MFGGHNHFGSEVIKILGCRLLLQDQMIKASYDFMIGSPPHGKSLPSEVGGHRHWGSGDMIFLLVGDKDSTFCRLNLVLLFIAFSCNAKSFAFVFYFIIIIIIIIIIKFLLFFLLVVVSVRTGKSF